MAAASSALVPENAGFAVARCCTLVARRRIRQFLERVAVQSTPTLTCEVGRERATRIELAFSAWEADVLPLNYARGWRPHYPLPRT